LKISKRITFYRHLLAIPLKFLDSSIYFALSKNTEVALLNALKIGLAEVQDKELNSNAI